MGLPTIRRLAARLLKAGESRIRILDAKAADEALTADDVRGLIQRGAVGVAPKTGVGRGKARARHVRARLGRGWGAGSRRGGRHATKSAKTLWMEKVRAQRAFLRAVRPKLVDGAYKRVYAMIKGNAFRDKRVLDAYLKNNQLLK